LPEELSVLQHQAVSVLETLNLMTLYWQEKMKRIRFLW